MSFGFFGSHTGTAQERIAPDRIGAEIIATERAALDRWIKLDPQGYLDVYGPDVTYFDPTTDKRVDGREAMQARLAPIKNLKNPFTNVRYEMIAPKVQRHGDVAVLTFNAFNYGTMPDRPETALSRWNATEVYSRIDGKWRIIHSHWSYVKPEIKPAS
jgi:uncharacterized protein (TIGR02246 family)